MRGSRMSDLTRTRTWLPVASSAAIRGTPGKFRSMIHNRSGPNTCGLLGQHPVQQRLLGLALVPTGLVPTGRADTPRPGWPGSARRRRAGDGSAGSRSRPARRCRTRPGSPSCRASGSPCRRSRPSRSPPPTSTRGSAGSRCSAPTAASSSRCSCCSGASPIAARQVDSTVPDGTACGRRHGTAVSSPSSVVSTSR